MNKILSVFGNKKAVAVGIVTVALIASGSVVLTLAQTKDEKAPAAAAGAGRPAKPSQPDIDAGKQIYFKKCVWCHGPEGAGDGPSADRLWPRPRNFNAGTFKIRTTASGELPTENDLFLTVTHGLPGSAMPSWDGILTDQQRHQVIAFVMTNLVKDRNFQDTENEDFHVIDFGKQIPTSDESIKRGKDVFMNKGKCVECHGNDERGDGNKTQKDEWGFPIFPADLHKCWNFRGNREDPYNPRNIFREVSTGLNGTPMPSFADALTPEQRWDVANFVISLCPKQKIDPLTAHPALSFVVKSLFVKGDIPSNPNDPTWQKIDPQYIGLAGQITHKPRNFVRLVDDVWVKSIFNGKEIGWEFEWDDRIKSVATPETLAQAASFQETPPAGEPIALRQYPMFNDAVAIQFPAKWQTLAPPEKPRFIFGDTKNAVDVWKWEADGTTTEYTGHGSIGGDLKLDARPTHNVKTVYAEYKDGRWYVIMTRAMTTSDKENDVQFEMGKYIPTVFFVWDGNNGDHGLKTSISTWYYTILQPPTPMQAYVYPFFAVIVVFGIEGWIIRKVSADKQKRK
ncbi:MAG TPA: c-type cytochrome [Nitrospiria bacterium]|nr:c-type cytochrome [Nitrospiria bacterium]